MSRAACVLGIVLGVLPVGGCNQDPPPEMDDDYYPLRDGARYEYQHSKDGWVEEVTLEADDDDPDRFTMKQSEDPDGNSSVSVIVRDGDDITRASEEQLIAGELDRSVAYDPGFLRFSAAWLDADEGDEDARTYERTETEAGEAPKPTAIRAHIYTVESLSETVTVPAGRFQNCLVVLRERDLENEVAGDGTDTNRDEQSKRFWFAPGVGKVREANAITGSTEELIAYALDED